MRRGCRPGDAGRRVPDRPSSHDPSPGRRCSPMRNLRVLYFRVTRRPPERKSIGRLHRAPSCRSEPPRPAATASSSRDAVADTRQLGSTRLSAGLHCNSGATSARGTVEPITIEIQNLSRPIRGSRWGAAGAARPARAGRTPGKDARRPCRPASPQSEVGRTVPKPRLFVEISRRTADSCFANPAPWI